MIRCFIAQCSVTLALLVSVQLANSGDLVTYSRDKFGGWKDEDRDCLNTRAEILIARSHTSVEFDNESKCRVVSGEWVSLFTNNLHTDASTLHIDHIVPLAWAWEHGASGWNSRMRISFNNDPINLAVVEASLNIQKGYQGPDTWLPPDNKCQYFKQFEVVRQRYKLTLTAHEIEDFKIIKSACSFEQDMS